jgi:Ca-activated chloride channel homolog
MAAAHLFTFLHGASVRTKLGVMLAAVAAALTTVSAGAQSPVVSATFKSSVDLVPISAIVHDHHKRIVTTLNASDFEVLDNGSPRAIVDFQRDHTSPMTIALLVDVSGSMRIGPKLPLARQVLERITGQLEDGRDEAALFTFDSALREEQPFTLHPRNLATLFDSVSPFGTTSLYDAIASTARRLTDRPALRRAIVVLTDGIDTSSTLTASEVSGIASSIDVPVYVVVTVPPIDQPELGAHRAGGDRTADLLDLAQWTGGDLMVAATPEHVESAARAIVVELRHQYLIAIESADRAEWRPLTVRTRDRHLTVRARSGYFGRDVSPSR